MKEIISFNDVRHSRSKMVRDILEGIEELADKYSIAPEEYNNLRQLIRARSFYFFNTWLKYLGYKFSPKYYNKINIKGENLDKDEFIS